MTVAACGTGNVCLPEHLIAPLVFIKKNCVSLFNVIVFDFDV